MNIIFSADHKFIKEMAGTHGAHSRFLFLKFHPTLTNRHLCYFIESTRSSRIYIGYTVDFHRRLRQHNGEIVGGAKRTRHGRPWRPICIIEGFHDNSSALRFEYRLHHPGRRRPKNQSPLDFALQNLTRIIERGEGSASMDNQMEWPQLYIYWSTHCRYWIRHPKVINRYWQSLPSPSI